MYTLCLYTPHDLCIIINQWLFVPEIEAVNMYVVKSYFSSPTRVSRDCNLMVFYQTYVKYCLLVHERREAFTKAKVLTHVHTDMCIRVLCTDFF